MTAEAGREVASLSAATTVVGVIGDPVSHSLSPRLHNAAFDALGLDWVSVGFPVPTGRATEAIAGARALGVAGLSVTMPHKAAAAAAADRLTAVADRLGAVNCLTFGTDGAEGDNTDGAGFLAALEAGAGIEPGGRTCAVVGAGGAARAVVLALAGAGAGSVLVVNRTRTRGEEAAALAGDAGRVASPEEVAEATVVVNATPVGMGGREPGAVPLEPALLSPGTVVVDLVYHPPVTEWLAAAAARGAQVLNGTGMLVHQAALQLERWTGRKAPLSAMWAALPEDVAGVQLRGGAGQ